MMRTTLTLIFLAASFSTAARATANQVACTTSVPLSMTIAYGDDLNTNCKLTEAGQVALFQFQGNAGDQITIAIAASWDGGPCADLYDPSDALVKGVCSPAINSNIASSGFTLAGSGQYTIRVHDSNYTATGTFGLMLDCWHPLVLSSPLTLGVSSNGTTVHTETIDDWTFLGVAGGDFVVQIEASYDGGPCFTLVDPTGMQSTQVCAPAINSNQARQEYTLQTTGTYALIVNSTGYAESGTYSLLVQCLASCAGSPPPAESQTITFGPLSNQALGTAPFALTAMASSGLSVTFVSNTSAVCTVSGSTVTLVATGTCSITATQPGNSTYAAAAPVTQTFTISPSTGPGITAYDLSSDWSNSSNPNGPWSYNQGSTPLPLVPNFNFANTGEPSSCNQPAWAPSNVTGDFLPAFLKVNACTAAYENAAYPANITVGDVWVHTVDSGNGNPSLGAANVLFTLPASGTAGPYTISGSLWDSVAPSATSISRPQDWSLFLNGVQIAAGVLSGSLLPSQAQTFSLVENLNVGDHVELQIVKDPAAAAGFVVSIKLTITSNAPLPPANCTYALAPAGQVIPPAAGTGSVGVLTSAGCPWSASSAAPFLTITSGSSGVGPGVVQFSATANTSPAAQTGTLTIAGNTATITQAGTAPLLLLNPSSIAVQWRQQSPPPIPIPLSVFTAANSLAFAATASSTGNWLSVSPGSGNAPATVIVTVNPSSLSPGPYQGTVTINAPAANPSSQTFTVSLTVVAAGTPALSVATTSLSYSFAQGAQQAQQQRILIGNSGGGTLSYQASASTNSGGNWLSVTQDEAGATPSIPDLLTVTVDPSGLASGTYTGLITISADTTQTIPVTVTVNAVQQAILLSQTGLTFTAVANGGIVPPQTFGVLNGGAGSMDWSVSSSVTGTNNWLSVTPDAGTTDASSPSVPLITVSVNAANLAPGQYSGQIQVASTTANNSPEYVSVILSVLPAGSNPGPIVLPTGLIFTEAAGGALAGSQTITLSNLTASQETFTTGTLTLDGANWFSVTPATGVATPTQATTLTVSVNSAGLSPGIRQGVLTLLFQDGSVRTVNILFVLATGGVSSQTRSGSQPSAAAASCTPTKLLPLLTSLGSQFTVPAAWPNTVQVQVVDDCGNPQVGGTVVASFSNGDPPLPLISLKNGSWTGTWQVSNTSASVVAVTVNADEASLGISGSVSISGSLQSSANAPVIRAGGVLNPASYTLSAPLAPGSMVSIFGSNLANGTSSASVFPLPSELSGTLVTIGGEAAPLMYAGAGQINAVVPYGLPVNTTTQIIVRQGDAYTAPVPIVMSEAYPAIFTQSGSGTGQGDIFRPDGNYAQPGTPAQTGDEVSIYCIGLGATTPQAMTGQAATASPLTYVAGSVSLTIGGQNARVDFAGLTPGFAGLYQVNAAVPAGVQGDTLPVVLTVAGQPSPPVTMAVQ